jgi:hypothetical protein
MKAIAITAAGEHDRWETSRILSPKAFVLIIASKLTHPFRGEKALTTIGLI